MIRRQSRSPLFVLAEPTTSLGLGISVTSSPFSDSVDGWGPSLGAELANIYLHARYYDSQLGMFLSPDPIGADSNTYRYAGGDPANFSDRSGLLKDPCDGDAACIEWYYRPTDPIMGMNMWDFQDAMGTYVGMLSLMGFSGDIIGAAAAHEQALINGGYGGAYTYVDTDGSLSVTMDPRQVAHDACQAGAVECINDGIEMDFFHEESGTVLGWGTRATGFRVGADVAGGSDELLRAIARDLPDIAAAGGKGALAAIDGYIPGGDPFSDVYKDCFGCSVSRDIGAEVLKIQITESIGVGIAASRTLFGVGTWFNRGIVRVGHTQLPRALGGGTAFGLRVYNTHVADLVTLSKSWPPPWKW